MENVNFVIHVGVQMLMVLYVINLIQRVGQIFGQTKLHQQLILNQRHQ